jgi:uncharacterized protein
MPRARLIASCSLSAVLVSAAAVSAQIGVGDSSWRVHAPARSLKDLRDQNVVKQRFDFSCGAAALATILRYGLGAVTTEREILVDLFGLLSDDERVVVGKTGFSLLHLQRVAQARGYGAEGFKIAPEQLRLLSGPVLVYIEPRGYKHFAVLRGIDGDRVFLADPSRGNIRLRLDTFLESWIQADGTGVIFVVESPGAASDRTSALHLAGSGRPLPEIMTARELLSIGNALVRPAPFPR